MPRLLQPVSDTCMSWTYLERRVLVSEGIQEAFGKRKLILDELRLIDQYIELHHRIFGDAEAGNVSQIAGKRDLPDRGEPVPKGSNDPSAITNMMKVILASATAPMPRGELRRHLAQAGIEIRSKDANKYLGTVLWRNSDIFTNIEGRGYWLKERRLPDDESLFRAGEES